MAVGSETIGRLSVEVGLDTKELDQGLSGVLASVGSAVQNLQATMQALGQALSGQEVAKATGDAANGVHSADEAMAKGHGSREQFSKDMENAGKKAVGLAGFMDTLTLRIRDSFLSLRGQVVAPLTGIITLSGALNKFISNAMSAGKAAKSLGVDVEDFQAWQGMAAGEGIDSGTFLGSMKALNGKISEAAKKGGDAAQAFRDLGVAFKDGDGKGRDQLEVLRDLAGQAEKLGKEQFVEMAKKLGLDEESIEMLRKGRAELDDLIRRQEEIGVYTKEDIELSKKTKIALEETKRAFEMLSAHIARILVPIIKVFATAMTDTFREFQRHSTFYKTLAALAGAAVMAHMLPPWKDMKKAIQAATAAAKLFYTTNSKTIFKVFPWALALMGFAAIIDDFITYVQGGNSALEGLWSEFGTGEEIAQTFREIWDSIAAVFKKVGGFLEALGVPLRKILAWVVLLGPVIALLTGLFGPWGVAIAAVGMAIGALIAYAPQIEQWFGEAIDNVCGFFSGMADTIGDIFDGVVGSIGDAISGMVDWIEQGIASMIKSVIDIPGKIGGGIKSGLKSLGIWWGDDEEGKDAKPDGKPGGTGGSGKDLKEAAAAPLEATAQGVNATREKWNDFETAAASAFGKTAAGAVKTYETACTTIKGWLATLQEQASAVGNFLVPNVMAATLPQGGTVPGAIAPTPTAQDTSRAASTVVQNQDNTKNVDASTHTEVKVGAINIQTTSDNPAQHGREVANALNNVKAANAASSGVNPK